MSHIPLALSERLEGQPLSSQTLTVSTTDLRLTIPAQAHSAVVQVQTNPVRLTLDGTAATASTGFRFVADDLIKIEGRASLNRVSLIREGAADATVVVQYLEEITRQTAVVGLAQ